MIILESQPVVYTHEQPMLRREKEEHDKQAALELQRLFLLLAPLPHETGLENSSIDFTILPIDTTIDMAVLT